MNKNIFINEDGKWLPETFSELKSLCEDESINLGNIDTSKITD